MNLLILYFLIGGFCVAVYSMRILDRTWLSEKRGDAWAVWFRKEGLQFIGNSFGLLVFWLPWLILSGVKMIWQGERATQ